MAQWSRSEKRRGRAGVAPPLAGLQLPDGQLAFAKMVGLFAGLDETRASACARAEPVLDHGERSQGDRADGLAPGEFLQADDLAVEQETLVALFGD